MTRSELNKILKISPYHLRNYVKDGTIKVIQINSRQFEYDEEDVKKLAKKLKAEKRKAQRKAKKNASKTSKNEANVKSNIDFYYDANVSPSEDELTDEVVEAILITTDHTDVDEMSVESAKNSLYSLSVSSKNDNSKITVSRTCQNVKDIPNILGVMLYAVEIQCKDFVTDEVYQKHINEINSIEANCEGFEYMLNEPVFIDNNIEVCISKFSL